MRYPGGSQEDPLCTPLPENVEHAKTAGLMEYHHGICQSHWQPSPERSPQAGASAMGLLTPETMLEEILVLYQEVYQLKRDPGEVQHSNNAAEEAHSEILKVVKACLWYRQGSSQPEEPRQTPRMKAEAEYYDQTWVTCDHFGSFQTNSSSLGKRP